MFAPLHDATQASLHDFSMSLGLHESRVAMNFRRCGIQAVSSATHVCCTPFSNFNKAALVEMTITRPILLKRETGPRHGRTRRLRTKKAGDERSRQMDRQYKAGKVSVVDCGDKQQNQNTDRASKRPRTSSEDKPGSEPLPGSRIHTKSEENPESNYS